MTAHTRSSEVMDVKETSAGNSAPAVPERLRTSSARARNGRG